MATIKKAQKGIVAKKAAKPAPKKAIPGPYSDERVKALDAASVYGKGKKTAPGYREGGKVAAGVGGKKAKAGMVDPKGAWTKVQERTIGKAQDGKKFPDLNKDGKITRADILKGRGVIAKKGAKVMKKCKYGCK